MKQSTIARALKIFTVCVAAVGSFFFFFYVPVLIWQMSLAERETSWLRWPGTVGMWVIALLCYLALWEFWRICTRIGRDDSFCRENARSMRHIGILAFVAAALILGGTIFLMVLHYLNAAGFLVIFFILCVAVGIGVLCSALSKLIENAASLKEENDLTI